MKIIPAGSFFILFFLLSATPFTPQVLAQSSIPIVGDANSDDRVDGIDYVIWLNNYASITTNGATNGDFNNDKIVDGIDYVLWLNHYGQQNFPTRDVLLFIDREYEISLSTEIAEFKSDVFQKLGVTVKSIALENISSRDPQELRNILISECSIDSVLGCRNIEGAIFVGDVPHALYDQKYDNYDIKTPFMFYYQDLDSQFSMDANGFYNGYETHGTHSGPEIYISWIKGQPTNSPIPNNDDELEQIRQYFEKHHRYFSGQTIPSSKAVAAIHCNIESSGTQYLYQPLIDLYGNDYVQAISPSLGCDNLGPEIPTLLDALNSRPEIAYIHSHGWTSHIWGLGASDFSSLENLPLLGFSWGCANGDFTENPNSSIALAFINGEDLGLTYIAKVESSDMISTSIGECDFCRFVNSQTYFFNYWGQGEYAGKALLRLMSDFTNFKDPNNPSSTPINFYEMDGGGPLQRIILGSPFVYSPTARE